MRRIGAFSSRALLVAAASLCLGAGGPESTVIARWPDGKRAALTITFDDGSINQFRVAAPILDRLGLPATFFVITGDIPGSRHRGRFLGRPTEDIVGETATVPTSRDNLFERASALGHLGLAGALEYHTRAGSLYEQGKVDEACRTIDAGYAKVRAGAFARQREPGGFEGASTFVTWDELQALGRKGHEIASHTITHPRLAVLDEPNLAYELEKSRQDILDHLGEKHTFSVECPYGTEDERVVHRALQVYAASRNRMPAPYIEELNRSSEADPAASTKEYVQWQRGPLTKTPIALMKSWVDTIAALDNVWLVLVFHGVDGVGWEPRTGAELQEYFAYVKSRETDVWAATFQDVTKYIRERQNASVRTSREAERIQVSLTHGLDGSLYDLPLTLETEVPAEWAAVEVRQGPAVQRADVVREGGLSVVRYEAVPNAGTVTLVNARSVSRDDDPRNTGSAAVATRSPEHAPWP